MKELIERLERATGPDQELDLAIATACQIDCLQYVGEECSGVAFPDHYTSSLDAALSLVPEGLSWAIKSPGFQSLSKRHRVHLETGDDEWLADGWTAPVAVCLAALKARL
jgi:hypothetical protein